MAKTVTILYRWDLPGAKRWELRVSGLHKGRIYVDMSTIDPDVSRSVAKEFANSGSFMLDGPISGSPVGVIPPTVAYTGRFLVCSKIMSFAAIRYCTAMRQENSSILVLSQTRLSHSFATMFGIQ